MTYDPVLLPLVQRFMNQIQPQLSKMMAFEIIYPIRFEHKQGGTYKVIFDDHQYTEFNPFVGDWDEFERMVKFYSERIRSARL